MDSTANRSFAALNDAEFDGLVEVIVEQFGSTLDRDQFADAALTLFDDMPGLETITTKQANRYVAALWRRYKVKSS
jgi:O-succinylbenzoate synthase